MKDENKALLIGLLFFLGIVTVVLLVVVTFSVFRANWIFDHLLATFSNPLTIP